MCHRNWLLIIAIVTLAAGAASRADADPREKQQSLQKFVRDVIQSSRVDREQQQDFERDPGQSWDWRIHNSSSGISFYVPQTRQNRDGFWYDLGWCKFGNMYFDFEHLLGSDSPVRERAPIASAASGPAPPPPAAGTTTSATGDNAAPAPTDDDETAEPDVFDYPLKAQLFVELVREYSSKPARRQGARPLKLDEATLRQIEQIERDEIKAIETAQDKIKQQHASQQEGGASLDEVSYLLMDYDARITRLVMAQLDAQADNRSLLLRKERAAAAGAGYESVQIAFRFPTDAPEPNRVLVMCGGNFDYLKSTWKTNPESNLDDKRWKSVHWEKADNKIVGDISPGRQAIVAVWDDNGKIRFARAHKYPDIFKGNEEVVFDALQPGVSHN